MAGARRSSCAPAPPLLLLVDGGVSTWQLTMQNISAGGDASAIDTRACPVAGCNFRVQACTLSAWLLLWRPHHRARSPQVSFSTE